MHDWLIVSVLVLNKDARGIKLTLSSFVIPLQ